MTYPVPITGYLAAANGFARACHARHTRGDPAQAMERSLLVQTVLREHRIRDDALLAAAVLHRLLAGGLATRADLVAAVGETTTAVAEQIAPLQRRTWTSQAIRARELSLGLRQILVAEGIVELESLPAGAWREHPELATQVRRFAHALCCHAMPISLWLRLQWAIDRVRGQPQPSSQGGRLPIRERVGGELPPPSDTSRSGRFAVQSRQRGKARPPTASA